MTLALRLPIHVLLQYIRDVLRVYREETLQSSENKNASDEEFPCMICS
jgi:hypothetical protein